MNALSDKAFNWILNARGPISREFRVNTVALGAVLALLAVLVPNAYLLSDAALALGVAVGGVFGFLGGFIVNMTTVVAQHRKACAA